MTTAARPPRRRRLRWLVTAVLLVVVGVLAWRFTLGRPAKKKPAAPPAVSVVLAPVERQDVTLTLEGLGTVVPLDTVVVKPRVDGQLVSVNFQEGQQVHKGDALAQIDPRPFQVAVAQAEGTLRRDRATANNNRLNLKRLSGLVGEHLVAAQQVDNARALVGQDKGVLAVDQAALANAKLNLEWTRVVAPTDGVCGIRQVDPGNLVHASDPNGIVVLTRLDPTSVVFTLPQDALPRVSEAMANGEPRVFAFDRTGDTLLGQGTLAAIDNQVNQTTATVRLRAELPNPDRRLWPNAFVRARLEVGQRKGALVIPSVAVQRGPTGPLVYVAASDGTAKLQPVEIDLTQGTLTVIKNGLTEGEQVVVDGQNQLRPGARMEVRSPAGGRPDGGTAPPGGARDGGPLAWGAGG